jgi:hypothetical protein
VAVLAEEILSAKRDIIQNDIGREGEEDMELSRGMLQKCRCCKAVGYFNLIKRFRNYRPKWRQLNSLP